MRPVRAPVLGIGGGGHGSQPHGPPVRGGRRTAGPPGRLQAGGGGGRQDFPTRFGTRAGSCERGDTLKGSRRSPRARSGPPGSGPLRRRSRGGGLSGSRRPEPMERSSLPPSERLTSELSSGGRERGNRGGGWEDENSLHSLK